MKIITIELPDDTTLPGGVRGRDSLYDAEAWATLDSDTSRPLDKPRSGRIAVTVINHLGDEVMKVFRAGRFIANYSGNLV